MSDQRILKVLEGARAKIADPLNWWDGRTGRCDSGCAGGGLNCALTSFPLLVDDATTACEMVAASMGVANVLAIPSFNDSHTHAEVLGAFDRAIATVKLRMHLEQTPNADAALAVIEACEQAGEIVARYIVSEHPQMDLQEITALTSQELFAAAQDTAQACHVGVKLERA